MKTTLGGERLGSGNKQEISIRNYERSTHDLSYLWRSSMSSGTLVPFMNILALPGDSFDIDLYTDVKTLPTVGPLFGSYKVQLDVFEIPMRLYNAKLHMNLLGVGMDMSKIMLPQMEVRENNAAGRVHNYADNSQINPSSLLSYLGIRGIGKISGATTPAKRYFNAIPLLAYWDIFKNYYANKQETQAYYIHTDDVNITAAMTIRAALLYSAADMSFKYDVLNNAQNWAVGDVIRIKYYDTAVEPDMTKMAVTGGYLSAFATKLSWDTNIDGYNILTVRSTVAAAKAVLPVQSPALNPLDPMIYLESFALENIDTMRTLILQHSLASAFIVDKDSAKPYSCFWETVGTTGVNQKYSQFYSQEGLAVKTYQSDLFNNWLQSEWIDGEDGINEITKVSTTGDAFTIDSLNLAQKVYNMLNRIALSGGTYDDWLDAVYTHERVKGVENPVYCGSLIKELAFEEVISNAETEGNPLGTLAGRGRLTSKNKGGKMVIKVSEPSYIMGIVSITPRVDYSQGNAWDVNLKTFDDLHKPALDAIGFQDLDAELMAWSNSQVDSATAAVTKLVIGKQPAWINYMTAVNKTYGNFADANKEMFMTLNRRYDINPTSGATSDNTTYIDPTKFNNIFAETALDSQNFWVQISANVTARRKMSAKVIPNL